jgi:hypothetical protein
MKFKPGQRFNVEGQLFRLLKVTKRGNLLLEPSSESTQRELREGGHPRGSVLPPVWTAEGGWSRFNSMGDGPGGDPGSRPVGEGGGRGDRDSGPGDEAVPADLGAQQTAGPECPTEGGRAGQADELLPSRQCGGG